MSGVMTKYKMATPESTMHKLDNRLHRVTSGLLVEVVSVVLKSLFGA